MGDGWSPLRLGRYRPLRTPISTYGSSSRTQLVTGDDDRGTTSPFPCKPMHAEHRVDASDEHTCSFLIIPDRIGISMTVHDHHAVWRGDMMHGEVNMINDNEALQTEVSATA